ncbi:polyketide synthase, partial [Streptomyces sp. NPDC127133]
MKLDDSGTLRRYLRQVTDALSQAERRLAKYSEPIAITGMACRFPGGSDSPEQLWDLVANGSDAMGPYVTDRGWSLSAQTDSAEPHQRVGGFVYDAHEFDAAFFKIAPREAIAMDPQQRLLLESSWAALENARIDPLKLRGTDSAVFIGATYQKYGLQAEGLRSDAYYLPTGTASSVLSGRIAYFLGFTGPAITIDTACSASLVALDAACHSLRRGDCSTALVGGVCVMNSQDAFDELGREWGLSRDGRCRAFAGSADGTGWGEGVGVLVVERLSDARRNGHR